MVVVDQQNTGFLIVSSLVAWAEWPELAGIEGTVRVALVVGDTGQVAVHTEVAAGREDPRQRRCRDRDRDEHRLS